MPAFRFALGLRINAFFVVAYLKTDTAYPAYSCFGWWINRRRSKSRMEYEGQQ
jgi:hypothetical protein